MADIIYNDEKFFDRYARLPRSQTGLDAAPEWPALQYMVGDVRAKKIVDLGCGYGWFCRWAHEAGAASVLGIDISDRMLERANEWSKTDTISYRQGDVANVQLERNTCDLVFSSLTFHYLSNIETLFANIFVGLRPGGKLVFSVEHPVWTAIHGWFVEHEGSTVWPLRSYADEGKKVKTWLGSEMVKYHRKLDTWINTLLGTGFVLRSLIEWTPSKEDLEAHPDWVLEIHRPAFLLIAVEKPAT